MFVDCFLCMVVLVPWLFTVWKRIMSSLFRLRHLDWNISLQEFQFSLSGNNFFFTKTAIIMSYFIMPVSIFLFFFFYQYSSYLGWPSIVKLCTCAQRQRTVHIKELYLPVKSVCVCVCLLCAFLRSSVFAFFHKYILCFVGRWYLESFPNTYYTH